MPHLIQEENVADAVGALARFAGRCCGEVTWAERKNRQFAGYREDLAIRKKDFLRRSNSALFEKS